MHSIKTLAVVLFSFLISSQLFAQETSNDTDEDKLSLYEGSIDNQFEYVIQKSYSYQEFKNVKKTWLYELKAHTLDSLKALQNDLDNTQKSVDSLVLEIQGLKTNLSDTKMNLANTIEEKDNMALFGMPMSKSNYSTIMWSIIGLLLILLLVFIYKFRNSNAVTRQSKLALSDIEEEFEEHRRTALEREQVVRRQLQDELNKQKKTK
ncbi:tRNA (guanine-N1)-methyltransferase [Subsaxibacter sp. CAU 1640]|uniref:tRNA (guanine-N1)-methyltransferase n=1 Tax=Subsaxibacter sp. CAU 1640 TaxID=2933271 RepID=UPI002002D148|nr:tRNA (guanine-N1)-methyltransferase [Subsaxibacter sp. CAU 1640]MCK7590865.1 tRNA (guanine-N1)-methyltransferase [Subsaxibacter sp. CAU 1640]